MTRVAVVVLNGFMTKETLTTETARYFKTWAGRAICPAHAGNGLPQAVAKYPKRQKHVTANATFYAVPQAQIDKLAATYGYVCAFCAEAAK